MQKRKGYVKARGLTMVKCGQIGGTFHRKDKSCSVPEKGLSNLLRQTSAQGDRQMVVDPKLKDSIAAYVKKHPGTYTDKIARKFKIGVREAHDAMMKLYREGKVEPANA